MGAQAPLQMLPMQRRGATDVRKSVSYALLFQIFPHLPGHGAQ